MAIYDRLNIDGDTRYLYDVDAVHEDELADGIVQALSTATVKQALLNMFYPVGSYYISANSTSPATLFGGTWTKVEGRFLLGSSSNYTLGATGGSANAIVPYHKHEVTATIIPASGSHTHSMQLRVVSDKVAVGNSFSRVANDGNDWRDNVVRLSGGASSGVHNHTVPAHSTQYAGTAGNATGANMPPYRVVSIWYRTA